MKKFIKQVVFATTVTALSGVAVAGEDAELLVSSFNLDGNTALTFDIVGNADVSALDFSVHIPNAANRNINLAGCVSGLPSSHTGQCSLVGEELKVIIYSPNNTSLPAGEIGTVQVDGVVEKFKAKNVHIFNTKGKPVGAQIRSLREGGDFRVDDR